MCIRDRNNVDYSIPDGFKPIELPSDEEIELESKKYGVHGVLFNDGAKWMKNQTYNQNK